jgi:hypothetical protein
MAKRENKIEVYFKDEVKRVLKGFSRKWVSPGMDGVPDQIPFWPEKPCDVYVEVKTTDGPISPQQQREHTRLRGMGALVFTVWGHAGVDLFIKMAKDDLLRYHHHKGNRELK